MQRLRNQQPSPVLSHAVMTARAHRAAALADFDLAATELHRLRLLMDTSPHHVDPEELVAADARAELARARFWDADAAYQRALPHRQAR